MVELNPILLNLDNVAVVRNTSYGHSASVWYVLFLFTDKKGDKTEVHEHKIPTLCKTVKTPFCILKMIK